MQYLGCLRPLCRKRWVLLNGNSVFSEISIAHFCVAEVRANSWAVRPKARGNFVMDIWKQRFPITRNNSSHSHTYEVRRLPGRRGIAGTRRGRVGLRLPHKSERGIRSGSKWEHGSLRTRPLQEQSHRYYAIDREYISLRWIPFTFDCPDCSANWTSKLIGDQIIESHIQYTGIAEIRNLPNFFSSSVTRNCVLSTYLKSLTRLITAALLRQSRVHRLVRSGSTEGSSLVLLQVPE